MCSERKFVDGLLDSRGRLEMEASLIIDAARDFLYHRLRERIGGNEDQPVITGATDVAISTGTDALRW